jgi:hypothetical protein
MKVKCFYQVNFLCLFLQEFFGVRYTDQGKSYPQM